MATRSNYEHGLAMVRQEFSIGFGEFVGHLNRNPGVGNEILFKRGLRKVAFEPLAENNSALPVESNEP